MFFASSLFRSIVLLIGTATLFPSRCAHAQDTPMTGEEIKAAAGDDALSDKAFAKLSPELKPVAIQAAMRKVADWQLQHAEAKFNQDWTYAPLYLGLLAASRTTGEAKYHDAELDRMAQGSASARK